MRAWRRSQSRQRVQGWRHQRGGEDGRVGPAAPSAAARPRGYGRPPLSSGSWRQTIPRWEKKFCTDVCMIPWEKLCETKKLVHYYPKVVEWNDSAAEEAFNQAKARFSAEINSLPCDLPLPDPDLYIDTVDYDATIDPELVEDVCKCKQPLESDEEAGSFRWDSFLFADKPVPVSGWGDEEEEEIAATTGGADAMEILPAGPGVGEQIIPTGWGDGAEENVVQTCFGAADQIVPTGWGDTQGIVATGWDDDAEDPCTKDGAMESTAGDRNAGPSKHKDGDKNVGSAYASDSGWHKAYNEPNRSYDWKRSKGCFPSKYANNNWSSNWSNRRAKSSWNSNRRNHTGRRADYSRGGPVNPQGFDELGSPWQCQNVCPNKLMKAE